MNSLLIVSSRKDKLFEMFQFALSNISFVFLSAYNFVSYATDFTAGLEATRITIIGLAVIGLLSRVVTVVGRALVEVWAERERQRIEIAREREKFNRDSLEYNVKALTTRINDLNRKMHDQANDFNRRELLHHEESVRLTHQLDIMQNHLETTVADLAAEKEINRQIKEMISRLQIENKTHQEENIRLLQALEKQTMSNGSLADEIRTIRTQITLQNDKKE